VQPYIRRDLPNKYAITTAETTVKGNRDALDFPVPLDPISATRCPGFTSKPRRNELPR